MDFNKEERESAGSGLWPQPCQKCTQSSSPLESSVFSSMNKRGTSSWEILPGKKYLTHAKDILSSKSKGEILKSNLKFTATFKPGVPVFHVRAVK